MKLHNINAAYTLAQTLYGVTPTPTEFEDIALHAWELIGNRHVLLFRIHENVIGGKIDLPCNALNVESVHYPLEDTQWTSNKSIVNHPYNAYIEEYIENWKYTESSYYNRGKLVKYRDGDGCIYLDKDYKDITVIYTGYIADDEGLPLVSDKELHAIAVYVAYSMIFREGLTSKNGNIISLSQTLQGEWLRACNAARIPSRVSQNDMDVILDAKTRWDRKRFGKSFKPIL